MNLGSMLNMVVIAPQERAHIKIGEENFLSAKLPRGQLRLIRLEQQGGENEQIRIKRIIVGRDYDVFVGDAAIHVLDGIPLLLSVQDDDLIRVVVQNLSGRGSVWVSFTAWCHVV